MNTSHFAVISHTHSTYPLPLPELRHSWFHGDEAVQKHYPPCQLHQHYRLQSNRGITKCHIAVIQRFPSCRSSCVRVHDSTTKKISLLCHHTHHHAFSCDTLYPCRLHIQIRPFVLLTSLPSIVLPKHVTASTRKLANCIHYTMYQ